MPYIQARCPTCGSNLLALDVVPVEVCVVCGTDQTDSAEPGGGIVTERPELNYPGRYECEYEREETSSDKHWL